MGVASGQRIIGRIAPVRYLASKGQPIPVFVTGDDQEARKAVLDLIAGTPFAGVDAGELINARKVSNLFALAMWTGGKYGRFAQGVDWRVAMDLVDSFILTVMGLPA